MYQEPWFMNFFNDEFKKASRELSDIIRQQLKQRREGVIMQVSYNGFSGELLKLDKNIAFGYDLSIYDRENKVTYIFHDIKMEKVKFLGGAVTFDG